MYMNIVLLFTEKMSGTEKIQANKQRYVIKNLVAKYCLLKS